MDKREYIQDSIDKLFATWLRRAAAFGAFIFLLLSFLDFVVFREHFARFLVYRFAIALFLLLVAVLAGKTRDRKSLRALGLAAVAVSAVVIEAMILQTGGHHSLYTVGMILLAVVALGFVPAEFPYHATKAAVIYGIYFLPIITTERIHDMPQFITTNFFMCSILLTVVVFRYLSMQTLRKQLGNEYELTASSNLLRESEARLRYLLAESQAIIYTCKPTGEYSTTFISENTKEQLGYEQQDFLDNPKFWASNIHPEDAQRVFAGLSGLFESGHHAHEYRFLRKDGAYQWMRDDLRLARDQAGRPLEIVGSWYDITERKLREKDIEYYQTQLEAMVADRTMDLERTIELLRVEVEEKILAKEMLLESETRFRTLFEKASEGILLMSMNAEIIAANETYARMHGYTVGEILNISLQDLEFNLAPQTHAARLNKVMTEGSIVFEVEHRHRDGHTFSLEVSVAFMELNNEKFLLCFHHDISDRKKAEKILQEKEEKMRAMLESFDGLIYICSPDYRVEFMNENLVRRTGRNAVGEPCYAVLNARDSICPWCVNERVFRGETVRYEIQGANDGLWYYAVNTPIRHADGSVSKQAMAMDITDKKRAELALKESEERYKRLVASVTDYIYTVKVEDGKPVATEHGEGCIAVTGYTPEEYQADPDLWYRMVHDADHKSVVEQARTIIAGETAEPLEHRIVHRNGSIRWVRHVMAPLFDKCRRLISFDGLISDITERKRLEEKLENARAQEEENLKLFSRLLIKVQEEERRDVARELHDEIGQSLTGLKLSVESVSSSLPPVHADNMRGIEASLGEMLDVVRNMSLNLRPSMLDDFGLVSTLQWYFERYKTQTGISVNFRQTGPERRFDQQKEIALYRITQEALTNVARHAGVKKALVELIITKDRAALRIHDTGRGFDTADPAHSSSGLSIMRERTLLENGEFFLYSTPGIGTQVAVTIPLQERKDGQATIDD